MFNTILLALDGSEASQRAIPLAEDLAKQGGGRIIVGHVREIMVGRGGGQTLSVNEDELEVRRPRKSPPSWPSVASRHRSRLRRRPWAARHTRWPRWRSASTQM